MEKEFINPPNLPKWEQSFSQIVVFRIGPAKIIHLSGQVSVNERNQIIGEGNLAMQAEQAFRNLTLALAAVGATAADVVKLNIYVVKYQPSDAAIINQAQRKLFESGNLPASTWVGVESLALSGLLIEVEAEAIVGG